MAQTTIQRVISATLKGQGSTLEELLLSGQPIEEITQTIHIRTGVTINSRTVRRWVESLKEAS